jgi:hypothetical protein
VLCRDAESLIDKADLAGNIPFAEPPNLSFSDHVHRLVPSYGVHGTGYRAKPEAGGDPLFD